MTGIIPKFNTVKRAGSVFHLLRILQFAQLYWDDFPPLVIYVTVYGHNKMKGTLIRGGGPRAQF